MSLERVGVWQPGVWAFTVWAVGVWYEQGISDERLEYTFNTNRLHYSVSNKSHYNLPIDRIHYNIEDKE